MGDRQTAEVGDIRASSRASPGLARPPRTARRRRPRADRARSPSPHSCSARTGLRCASRSSSKYILFLLTLPGWVFLAKLHELYDHDEERTEHTTLDDFVGVLHVVTLAVWTLYVVSHITGLADPGLTKVTGFWAMAIAFIVSGRAAARALCRRSSSYIQNTIIVGAGDVGQLVARKFLQHPEYGINLVGFVDSSRPRPARRPRSKRVLGGPSDLPMLIEQLDVDRVVIAFSTESNEDTVELVARLKSLDVQIDIVPAAVRRRRPERQRPLGRGTATARAAVPEAAAVLAHDQARPRHRRARRSCSCSSRRSSRSSRWRIRRDSPRPVFFRQARLGQKMQPFTALKFRTMKVDTDDDRAPRVHPRDDDRASATPTGNGLYKLERPDAITRTGRWLRKTSLDELPQLINVLRGEMSLVGPRPCIPYETEYFAAAPLRALPRPAGHHRALAGDRPRALDLRRGARHGRRLCAQLVARPRPDALAPHTDRSFFASEREPPDEARTRSASLSSASATGARTSSATCTSSPTPRSPAICDLDRGRARARRPALPGRRAGRRGSTTSSPTTSIDAVAIATPVSTHYAARAARRSRPASTSSSRSRSPRRRPRHAQLIDAARRAAASCSCPATRSSTARRST